MKKLSAIVLTTLLLGASCTTQPVVENTTTTVEVTPTVKRAAIDLTKLPLGDGLYSTSPQLGYVYTCHTNFSGSGAYQQGPWINADDHTWDATQKISVSGDVSWPNAEFATEIDGDNRVITTKALPVDHTTGVYPISSTDEAYQYDQNPNEIKEQTLTVTVPANPTLLDVPDCVGGEVGIMLTGVPLFSAFDAGGRDAVATEVQDDCAGHPQVQGEYHYHGYSGCLQDNTEIDQHSELVGYAYDGFGIFGLKSEGGLELATADLDVCHGHTHEITWDGETKAMYHYHMTPDFPYSVGCFRGESFFRPVRQ